MDMDEKAAGDDPDLFNQGVFQTLVAAEMFAAGSQSSPSRRGHVAEQVWPAADPVLQGLLAWWNSPQCTLTANHNSRLAAVQRYLAFGLDAAKVDSARLKDTSELATNVSDRAKVSRYCEFLQNAGLAADTIKKRLLALRHVVAWYKTMVLCPGESQATKNEYDHAYTRAKQTEEYFSVLVAGYQRQHAGTRNDRSIGSLVRANLWPKDEEVRSIIRLNVPDYCTKLKDAQLYKKTSKHEYAWCLSFILNAILIHGSTARAGFFANLTIGIAKQAIEGGLCASTNFKTSKTYLVQVIALDSQCRTLVQEYISVWRPLVAPAGVAVNDQDKLFLNSAGRPVADISKVVSILWEQSFSRPMCINTLRYWKSTHHALAATTQEERQRALKAEGHSDRVTRLHYEKLFAIQDAAQAKKDNDRVCKLTSFERPSADTTELNSLNATSGEAIRRHKRKRHPWSMADTYTLLDHQPKFDQCPDKWEKTLESIRPLLQFKDRNGTALKDRFRWATEKIRLNQLPPRPEAQQEQQGSMASL